jgi:hypothetical protein
MRAGPALVVHVLPLVGEHMVHSTQTVVYRCIPLAVACWQDPLIGMSIMSPVLGQAVAQVPDTAVLWNMPNDTGSSPGMPHVIVMRVVCYMSCALGWYCGATLPCRHIRSALTPAVLRPRAMCHVSFLSCLRPSYVWLTRRCVQLPVVKIVQTLSGCLASAEDCHCVDLEKCSRLAGSHCTSTRSNSPTSCLLT